MTSMWEYKMLDVGSSGRIELKIQKEDRFSFINPPPLFQDTYDTQQIQI